MGVLRNDRIDVCFKEKDFLDVLQRWKDCCKFIEGGQAKRLIKIIKEDIKKLKVEVMNQLEKS